jgi:hypothetical protein
MSITLRDIARMLAERGLAQDKRADKIVARAREALKRRDGCQDASATPQSSTNTTSDVPAGNFIPPELGSGAGTIVAARHDPNVPVLREESGVGTIVSGGLAGKAQVESSSSGLRRVEQAGTIHNPARQNDQPVPGTMATTDDDNAQTPTLPTARPDLSRSDRHK